jgi:L-arabinokinase
MSASPTTADDGPRPDAESAAFLMLIGRLARQPGAPLFRPDLPVAVARAPGRLDVMGGIADYSGSLVLQWPAREATYAAVQPADDGLIRVMSLPPEGDGAPPRAFACGTDALDAWARDGYDAARAHFAASPDDHWAAYVVGSLLALAVEAGARLPGGARVLVRSYVPESKGLSSSAALEVAVLRAASGLATDAHPLDGAALARIGQVAENRVVGAACGIMDQMASALGRADHLLALRCQPAEVEGLVRLPDDLAVWGIDSGIRHAVSGSDYTGVRVGAFMGYRMIADRAGLEVWASGTPGVVHVDDPRWGGYLANLSPEEFDREFGPHLPEATSGAAFLSRFAGTTDRVTRVDPARTYAVRGPTAHPIRENDRVRRFAALLQSGARSESDREELGALMFASHASYSACGLGSDGTDELVDLVRAAGPGRGLFGAKITGGGSGGVVAVLGRKGAEPVVREVAATYALRTGRAAGVHAGSSPGACDTPVRMVIPSTL